MGGPEYLDDDFFVAYADEDARRLVDWFAIDGTTRILDVGCGQGRLAIGIIRQLGAIGAYCGLDLDGESIRWCRRHITSAHPAFEFARLDVENERYNPGGRPLDDRFRFPFADGDFDLVYMSGVSPHLDVAEHRVYLREFRRLLAGGGSLYLTAFLEDGVPPVTVNPEDYRGGAWTGPRNCIRYEASFFRSLLEEAGFGVERFEHGSGMFGLSLVAAAAV